MPLSFSQTHSLTCPQCKTPFHADIWLIVDAGERPDLAARCHDGSIHVVACPNHHSGMLAAPLLYHDRAKQQLFLAYPQNMTEQQVQQVGGQLIQQLRGQMLILPGSAYLDAPQAIPIELLPAAMDDKLEEVMAALQQQAAQFEKLRNHPALRVLQEHQTLAQTIQAWMNLDAWNASKEFLQAHPELLSADAELVLAALLDLARAQDDANAQEVLETHREILRAARTNGVDAAFERLAMESHGSTEASRVNSAETPSRLEPTLTSDSRRFESAADARAELQARLNELNIHSQQELERALPDHPELQELIARVLRDENPILQAIEKLMDTRSPHEVIQLVRSYPMLLDDEGLNAIREIIANARERGDEGTANHLQERFAILEQIQASGIRVDQLGQLDALAQTLDDETRAAIEELRALGISNAQELEAALEKRPDLRAKLERVAQRAAPSNNLGDIPDDVAPLIDEISRLTRLSEMPRKIELCRAALERVPREQNAMLWAMLNGELANALNQNPQGSRADNLEQAIYHYEQIQQVYTRAAFPEDWAMTQNNLANAYLNRIRGERADNLEEAIRHYELALEVRTRAAFPVEWAGTQNNLALAYADRIRGERADNLEKAIRHYEQALLEYTADRIPARALTTARNLGNLYVEQKNWRAAHRAFGLARDAAETLLRVSFTPEGQKAEMRQLADLYDRDLAVCAQLVQDDATVARDALAASEAARSRAFLRQLGLGDFAPPNTIPAPLVAREKNIIAQLRESENNLAAADTRSDRMSEMERTLTARRKQLGDELERVWNEMLSAASEAAAYVSLRRADTPKWNDLSALAASLGQDAALVEFHVLEDQTLVFVWRAGWDAPKMLSLPLTRERLLYRFLLPYEREILNTYRRSQAEQAGRELYHDWLGLGEELLAPLVERRSDGEERRSDGEERRSDGVERRSDGDERRSDGEERRADGEERRADGVERRSVGEERRSGGEERRSNGEERRSNGVERRSNGTSLLGDASLVYFIPHGFLHLLPLHALTVNGEPFIAQRAVAYAPSAAVLKRVLEQNTRAGGDALVMGYTHAAWQRDIFVGEAIEVAKLFGTTAVADAQATRAALAQRAPNASLIHLSCHGAFDGNDSLNSAVELADGKFTARDWMRLDLRADLVTLSACQLAFNAVNPGDDLVGMTRALLYAGASSVLLALWSVRADTTLEWMLDFYKRIQPDGTVQTKAHAFRDATLALRAKNDDPYIWAPFVLVGDWM
jgi:hypothetical protein